MTSPQPLLGALTKVLKASLLTLVLGLMALQLVVLALDLTGYQKDRLNGTSEQGPVEDYVVFYAAGKMVGSGDGDELYDVDSITRVEHEVMGRPVGGSGKLAYFNPPFVALGFLLPSYLPVKTFSLVLLVFLVGMVTAAGVGLSRFLGLTGWQLLAFAIGFLSLRSVYWLLLEGQLSMFVFLGWLGFVAFYLNQRKSMAGASLALVLVKPQMAVILVAFLIWKQQWEALRVFTAIAGALVLVSLAVSSPQAIYSYPAFLLESTGFDGKGVSTMDMFGLNGLIARLTNDPNPSTLWLVVLGPIILLGLAERWRNADLNSRHSLPLLAAMTLCGALLTNPHLYFQDMTLLALIVGFGAYATKAATGRFGYWPLLGGLVWIVQSVTGPYQSGTNLLTPLILILFLLSYWELQRAGTLMSARMKIAAPLGLERIHEVAV